MNSLVIFATHSGNTELIAIAIAEGLDQYGAVTRAPVETAPDRWPSEVDVVVIGGPTEGHRWTDELSRYVASLVPESVRGRKFAAYDTRVHWPQVLSGSAAHDLTDELGRLEARAVVAPESFFVTLEPKLQPGELDRARDWAHRIAEAVLVARTVT